jgi:hypothetical protein
MLYETPTITDLQIFAAQTVAYSLILLSDLLACLYTLLKIYRILCYSKITFDQLPLANPYTWPVAFFRIVTQPYFRFWARLLPMMRFGNSTYDVSLIVGLEALSCFIFLSLQIRMDSFLEAQKILEFIDKASFPTA